MAGRGGQAYRQYRAVLQREGQNLPRQTRGAHRLDRNVVDDLSTVLAGRGHNVTTVRAAFGEGEPVFPGSALLDRSHVQITIRGLGAILRTWRMI